MKNLFPQCLCGQPMEFEPGQNRTFCKTPGCGVVQERGPEGYWAWGETRNLFTPIFAKKKLSHYEKYMRWRNQQRSCQKFEF